MTRIRGIARGRSLLHFLLIAVLQQTSGAVFQLSGQSQILCAKPAPGLENTIQPPFRCVAGFPEDVIPDAACGLRPDGNCTVCGLILESGPCTSGSVVSYFKSNDQRYCACNIGYYGTQVGAGCKKCPAGTTTQGYGATSVKECNICAEGYTGVAAKNSCKPCSSKFKGPITTDGPGDNKRCVCPLGYIGKPGSCTKCVGWGVTTAFPGAQTCVCPAGGKAPFCIPCLRGAVVKGKCECPAGLSGVWPKCQECPSFFGYDQLTFTPGNNQPCQCNLAGRFEDLPDRYYLDADPKTGACMCAEGSGRYMGVVPNPGFDPEIHFGPCEDTFNSSVGQPNGKYAFGKLLVLGGKKRVGCDVSKGYGVNVAAIIDDDRGDTYCIKCTGPLQVLDPVTSRCDCKPGYGINSFYATYPNSSYCVKIQPPTVILGKAFSTRTQNWQPVNDNLFARCNPALQLYGPPELGCKKCPVKVMKASLNGCSCPEEYNTKYVNFSAVACEKRPCNPDLPLGTDNACPCTLFKEANGKCVFPATACNQMRISIWTGVSAADGVLPFSAKLLNRKPAATLQVSYTDLNKTANILSLAQPKLSTKTKVAVLVKGCFCTRIIPVYRVIEVTAAGNAQLVIKPFTDVSTGTVRSLDASKGLKTDYSTMLHRAMQTNDLCKQFEVSLYSGKLDGLLRLRSVIFPFDASWEQWVAEVDAQRLGLS